MMRKKKFDILKTIAISMRQFVPHVTGKYLKLSLFLFIVKEEKEYEKRQDGEATIKMNKLIILNLPL